jgi:hypothetical protein
VRNGNRVRIELAPQASDQHLYDIAVALEVLIVKALGELGLGNDFSGPQHQVLENAVLERRELDGPVLYSNRLRTRVEHDWATAQLRAGPAAGTAQQRLQTRQHLLEMKRLGDIVVRARLQALHLVLPVVARGEDQNRIGFTGGAQPADHLEP